jgi:hypothetical protein
MENYRIYFEEGEEDEILRILRRSSDILIDNINNNSIGITVEKDDADSFYVKLMDLIDQQVYAFRPHHSYHYHESGGKG